MMKKIAISFLILIFSVSGNAQELNASVTVNYTKATAANPQIFKSLERQITDFVNNNVWTNRTFKPEERINCTFSIVVDKYENNALECTLQVQASRPVYGSNYSTSTLNINDKDFAFPYTEFQQMNFNENSFDSNLLSTLAFYCNIIIGIDAYTFGSDAGLASLEKAQNIAGIAMTSGVKGWSQDGKNQNKYQLINDLISPTFKPYLDAMYQYHFLGLDKMSDNVVDGKNQIANAINTLSKIQDTRPNSYLMRIFFDTKADEVTSIFAGGPQIDKAKVVQQLNRISPLNSAKWDKI